MPLRSFPKGGLVTWDKTRQVQTSAPTMTRNMNSFVSLTCSLFCVTYELEIGWSGYSGGDNVHFCMKNNCWCYAIENFQLQGHIQQMPCYSVFTCVDNRIGCLAVQLGGLGWGITLQIAKIYWKLYRRSYAILCTLTWDHRCVARCPARHGAGCGACFQRQSYAPAGSLGVSLRVWARRFSAKDAVNPRVPICQASLTVSLN